MYNNNIIEKMQNIEMAVKGLSNNEKIIEALKKFKEVVYELAGVLEEYDYEFSDAAPEYLRDIDDFVYEIESFVEDETDILKGDENEIEYFATSVEQTA